ncbi:hypothetical protein [Arvimicrobium flavum]|uniref:hypothetical protein n=1 Tax=Arvimicrobium flavum TaxID=3393320 RepID=UPI00237B24CE|nr:hypothetical protein [Mesorhizobium shangrilense]
MKLIYAVMALLAVAPAWASDIPRYDPPRYCKSVSDFGGGGAMIYNGCIQMEQEAYDSLKRIWNGLPSKTKHYCDEVARFGDRSYAILKGCIDMESDAASSTPGFRF